MIDHHTNLINPDLLKHDFNKSNEPNLFNAFPSGINSSERLENACLDSLLTEMDLCGIEKSVSYGLPCIKMRNCIKSNNYLIDCVKNSKRIIGVPVVNCLSKGAIDEIKRCHENGLKGVHLKLSWQNNSFSKVLNNNKFWKFLEEGSIPIYFHCSHAIDNKIDCPYNIIQLKKRFPGLRLVLEHLGGGLFIYMKYKPIKKFFADTYFTSAVPRSLYMISYAKRILGDKLLFGSDYPFNDKICQKFYLESFQNCV